MLYMPLKIFLFLIGFWLLSTSQLYSQSLSLSAKGKTENETKIIDSLYYIKNFEDFASLEKEVIDIKEKLLKLGYIESELLSI